METEKQSSSLGELEFPNTTYPLRFGYFSSPATGNPLEQHNTVKIGQENLSYPNYSTCSAENFI